MTVARASDRLNQTNALIVAQSVRGHAAPLCHASDGVASVSHNSNVHLRARSKSRLNTLAMLKIEPVGLRMEP